MPNQPPKTGVFAHLYVNSGVFNSPTWVEIVNVRDVDLDDEMVRADATIRGDGGLAAELPGPRKIGLKCGILWNTGGADFAILHPAYLAETPTEFLALDGPSNANSGSQGPRFTGIIFKFARKEGLSDSLTADLEIGRTVSSNPTSWFSA